MKKGKKIACYECEHYVDGDEFCHGGHDMGRMNSRCKAWKINGSKAIRKLSMGEKK